MEERRQFMLDQVLTPEAKERLSRIGKSTHPTLYKPNQPTHPPTHPPTLPPCTAIVRKDKVRAVEDMLLGAATSGRLGTS